MRSSSAVSTVGRRSLSKDVDTKQMTVRNEAHRLYHSIASVHPMVFETFSRALPPAGEGFEIDINSLEVGLKTTASYATNSNGLGVRLNTSISRSDCSLQIDSVLHFSWDEAPEWNPDLISAFMSITVPEAFGYQRPIFDQMVQMLDLPKVTLTVSDFMEAAEASARAERESTPNKQGPSKKRPRRPR